MKIKGVALLARKAIVTQHFGEAAWTTLYADMARRHPYFQQPLLATSTVPLTEFLDFQDELVRRFYGGQQRAYFGLGEQSARWAVSEGPYRAFIADKDYAGFVQFFPRTWTTYFVGTESYCQTRLAEDGVDFMAFKLPRWHPYLEYFVVGYFKGGLELISGTPFGMKQMLGGRGSQYHYKLWVRRESVSAGSEAP